jgi:ABC-type bacteriocin/lantibiotic exporter with double-glycine peptidase domain
VLLDGRNLRDLDLDLVRAQMGVVIQDGKITRTSILKNILGGAGNDERLAWEAAEKAALADDIRAMPMKMQTVVDPQLLSGGQAQRIMLARALVRRPNVVVLDEATSALDNLAQASVTEALTQLGATRVVVAHRLSTIRSADRILVIEKGRVIEDGDYDTLMAKPAGAFRALAQRQLA